MTAVSFTFRTPGNREVHCQGGLIIQEPRCEDEILGTIDDSVIEPGHRGRLLIIVVLIHGFEFFGRVSGKVR